MLDVKAGLKDKKPGKDAEQGQLKRRTQKPELLLKPDRGGRSRVRPEALLPGGGRRAHRRERGD